MLASVAEQAKQIVLNCIYNDRALGFHESLTKEGTKKIKVQDALQEVNLGTNEDKKANIH